MALTLTVTVEPNAHAARLAVTGAVGPFTASAAPLGDRPEYAVRGTFVGGILVDAETPLAVPVTYTVTNVPTGEQVSATVTVPADAPILSDSLDPYRNVTTRVVSQKPNGWAARSVWWDILGRRDPFVSVAPMRLRSGDLVLRAEGNTERRALIDLLATGNPLLLRSPCPSAVDDVTVLPEDVTEDLVMSSVPDGPVLFTVRYQAVSRELGPYLADPSRTYATVLAEGGTYATLIAWGTYDRLRTGVAP